MPLTTASRDRNDQRNITKTHAVSSRKQALPARSSRRGPVVAGRNNVRKRAHGTPSTTAAVPTTLHAPTTTSPRAPTFSPNKRRRKQTPTTVLTRPQTGTKRQWPHSVPTTPDPKRHRQQHARSPDGRRDWSADHNNPTGNAVAPAARSGDSMPAALRRLDVCATSAPSSSPPGPDRAAADRDQAPPKYNLPESDRAAADRPPAPPTARVNQSTDKRRRERDQDADKPTKKQTRRKLRAQQDRPTDSTL